ncbi:hypothetical protein [Trichloromonas sp.]|uniref:hypothetical protein n=1 Tax=Trichloromonas sp. TaxID=3069249 RepID=UPI002A3753DD|nr:hypothetical protein [Trichloromonas sp.]
MKKKLIEFNKIKNGIYYDINSCDWNDIINKSKNGLLLGELGHQQNNQVMLTNISHIVKNIQLYQDGIVGDIQILDTQNGKILKELVNNGFKINYSARYNGNVDSNGKIIDAKILSFDAMQVPYDILEIRNQKIKKIKKLINEKRFN